MLTNGRRSLLKSGVSATIGIAGLSGCLGNVGGGNSTLRLNFTVPIENVASLASVPQIQDQFANLGNEYEIETSRDQSTVDSLNALAAGEADMVAVSIGSYPGAVVKEAVPGGITGIAMDFYDTHKDYFSFTVYSGPDSGITKPQQLEGKKVAVNALGTSTHANYILMLRKVGLNPDEDVEFVELGFPSFTSAIKDGRIDAGMYPAFFAPQAREAGFTEVFTTHDYWGEATPHVFIVASKDSLNKKEDAFRAWGEDYDNMISNYLFDNRSEVISAASEHFDVDESFLDSYYLTKKDYFRKSAQIDIQGLQRVMDELAGIDFLKEKFDVSNHATNEYLP